MKRKLTVLMLILAVTLVLSACVPGTCVYHVDIDKNAKCDVCGKDVECDICSFDMSDEEDEEEYGPVPWDDEESYVTTIHSSARTGGIAKSTPNFTACTAFLDYQSTHSTHILDEYYDYKLQYQVVDGEVEGTVEMLQFIRKNVRSSFNQIFEDAPTCFYDNFSDRWQHILLVNGYQYDIRTDYAQLRFEKEKIINNLHKEYSKLP